MGRSDSKEREAEVIVRRERQTLLLLYNDDWTQKICSEELERLNSDPLMY
jgi:hypothetical protein